MRSNIGNSNNVVYLDLKGIISFKEFVSSLRKGSLRQQIEKLTTDRFHDISEIGPITIDSVKLSFEDDCVKIIPEMRKNIDAQISKEPLTQSKPHYKHTCPAVRCRDQKSISKSHLNKEPEDRKKSVDENTQFLCKTRRAPIPANGIKQKTKKYVKTTSKSNGALYQNEDVHNELKQCIAERQIIVGGIERMDINEQNMNNLDYAKSKLSGNVKSIQELFSNRNVPNASGSYRKKRKKSSFPMNGNVKNKISNCPPDLSAGYKWQRDYESTDDESLWQRLGFGLNLLGTPRSETNSVSSGDFCIHDHHYTV